MVDSLLLYNRIVSLPATLQEQASTFVEFLEQKAEKEKPVTQEETKQEKKTGFGGLKGKIIMSPDFDEPLEDFKDYM